MATDLFSQAFVDNLSLPVGFRADHLDDLPPPSDEFAEGAGLLRSERSRLRPNLLGEQGDDLGVDSVGLGELAQCAGKVADLARVDHGERQAAAGQRGGDGRLETAGGLDHDQPGVERDEAFNELLEAFAVARDGKGLARRAQMHVKAILGHIDTDAVCHAARFVHDPSLRMRARSAQSTVRAFGQSDASRAMLTNGLSGPEEPRAGLRPYPRRLRVGRQMRDTRSAAKRRVSNDEEERGPRI